jgi:THO complex subunit 2
MWMYSSHSVDNTDPNKKTHGVLLQYLELLTSPQVVSPSDYASKVVPSLAELGEKYGISAPIFMQVVRPILNAALLVCFTL